MWRKSVHDTIGFFDGTMRAAGDYDFNLRLAQKFTALHLPIALGSYLAHEGAISFADGAMQRETHKNTLERKVRESNLRAAPEGPQID